MKIANPTILNPEVQEYIYRNTVNNVSKLAFTKNPFPFIDFKIILNQIEARAKCKDKLCLWFNLRNIIYPSKISIEQTSSDTTAQYKASLVSGRSLIDMTGGFGVDSYYFSKKMKVVIHCEIDATLSEIVSHNFKLLRAKNILCKLGDSANILTSLNANLDWIYVDPSRRNESKGKVFMLSDCAPDVPSLLPTYFNYTKNILLKTAPLLDIAAGLSELQNVKAIHIVAIENEVKELLWVIEKNYSSPIVIKTINSKKETCQIFQFVHNSSVIANLGLPKKYLYEPNSAIMKSGGFAEVTAQFPLEKLHQHSHLYTSDDLIEFPGRVFQIENIIDYSKKEMREHLSKQKANITTRNFPDSVDTIRNKWNIKDGGNRYCFFTTDMNESKIVLLCTKIN